MLWPACRAAFSRCRRCLRVSRTPATLTSAAALRSGRGSVRRIAFQGRMVVDPRLGTNHAAEVGAGPDRPVMRACRSGSERSDWKERNQSRRAIGIVPDHSSRTCSDLAIPSVQIIAETGFTDTGLVSSFAGSGHTVLDSPTAQSLTPGDFLDAIASADLVEPDQLASMNRRGNLGPGSRTRTLHTSSSTS